MNTPTGFFLDRFKAIYPHHGFSSVRPLAARVNTIRSDADSTGKILTRLAIPFNRVSWYREAFVIPGVSARQLSITGPVERGELYIQSLSSMIPPLVLDPKGEERVLDMAAAPGSKTSELAALMGNRGEIIANDIDKRRLYKLNAVLDILGVANVSITSLAGQSLWQKFPEAFDKVLLDAPCSMEGSLFYPSGRKAKDISKLQKWMLRSAVSAAKPGGTIVYSTCSMAPEENEEVISWLLEKEKGRVELAEVTLSVPEAVPGMTVWQGKTFDASLGKTIRIPPTGSMEQFFVAKLIKKEPTVPSSVVHESAS